MKKYNKLVRDKIPDIIRENGDTCVTHVATEEDYWSKLKDKLQEEVAEFIKDENEEEMADVMEVLDAIVAYKQFDKKQLTAIQKEKFEKRGGFEKRIILEKS